MKKRNTMMSAVALAALAAGPTLARNSNTVIDVISDNPDHHLFLEAASAAGLDDVLDNDTGFTLFLPTDEALEEAGLDLQLSEPLSPDEKQQLVQLLESHIVEDEVTHDGLGDYVKLETAAGTDVAIKSDNGNVFINSASLVKPDIVASNGVVHVIDSVLEASN
jgi:uncharacterized surface protein with fasciclin (FAS1) repeats